MNLNNITIRLRSQNFDCDISIREKLTFIWGDSGVGKTRFTDIVSKRTRYGADIQVSNNYRVAVLSEDTVITDIEEGTPVNARVVYIVDDEDYVMSDMFSDYVKLCKNAYFIIINRANIPSLSYSASEVYTFVAKGKKHYIEPYYKYKTSYETKYDEILVEGVGSDFTFFSNMYSNSIVKHPVIDGKKAGGNANVCKYLEKNELLYKGKTVLLFIDWSGFGSCIQKLMRVSEFCNFIIFDSYLSFEYFLLHTTFFNIDVEEEIKSNTTKYMSIEKLSTALLQRITADTPLEYSKSSNKFKRCYYINCCAEKSPCDIMKTNKGFISDKFEALLRGTGFEFLLNYRG